MKKPIGTENSVGVWVNGCEGASKDHGPRTTDRRIEASSATAVHYCLGCRSSAVGRRFGQTPTHPRIHQTHSVLVPAGVLRLAGTGRPAIGPDTDDVAFRQPELLFHRRCP